MKFIAIFVLIAAASAQTPAPTPVHPTEFLAQVFRVHGTPPNDQRTMLALGVMINQRHIITVADRVHNVTREELRVHLQTATFGASVDVRTVEVVILHDNFVPAQRRVNNIAILRIPASALATVTTRPRMLGTLIVPNTCRSFIFSGWMGDVSTREVTIANTGCVPNTQLCTARFPLGENITSCIGAIGSPVICADGNYVDGINIDDMDCANMVSPLQAQMSLLSIHAHVDWILYHSDANINAKVSVILVLLSAVIGKILI